MALTFEAVANREEIRGDGKKAVVDPPSLLTASSEQRAHGKGPPLTVSL
jgi:hypothetical protein